MTRHGIEPSQQTIAQFIQFCEYLLSMEQIPRVMSPIQVCGNINDEMQEPAGKSRKHQARNNGSTGQSEEKHCVKLQNHRMICR